MVMVATRSGLGGGMLRLVPCTSDPGATAHGAGGATIASTGGGGTRCQCRGSYGHQNNGGGGSANHECAFRGWSPSGTGVIGHLSARVSPPGRITPQGNPYLTS